MSYSYFGGGTGVLSSGVLLKGMRKLFWVIIIFIWSVQAQENMVGSTSKFFDPELRYTEYRPNQTDRVISRSKYMDQLWGFWLAQCIANWTGSYH